MDGEKGKEADGIVLTSLKFVEAGVRQVLDEAVIERDAMYGIIRY